MFQVSITAHDWTLEMNNHFLQMENKHLLETEVVLSSNHLIILTL